MRSGRVTFDGADTTGFAPRRMLDAGMCYVPQGRNLFPELSVKHNLELGGVALADRSGLAARMDEMMARFPMLREKADAQASTLSGGQQKLLEVARGLLLNPKLMLIDEPSIGLSPLMVQEVFSILKGLRDAGVTILLIEQNARAALRHLRLRPGAGAGPDPHRGSRRRHPRRPTHCPALPGRRNRGMSKRMLVGLIGTNIGQSLAPALHEDAFAAAGMVGHYHLMDVDGPRPRTLPELLAAVRTAGFAGVNVTFPFKEAVIPLLDAVSPEAAEIGAVNTVVFDPAGRSTGHNTDRSGFRAAFIEAFGARRRARQGGAAARRRRRGPRGRLRAAGSRRVVAAPLRSRRPARAQSLRRPRRKLRGPRRARARGRIGRGHRQCDADRHDRPCRPADDAGGRATPIRSSPT